MKSRADRLERVQRALDRLTAEVRRVLFAEELRRRLGRGARRFPLQRLSGELFMIGDRLFIANSDPDLVDNLGICLAHYFRPPAFRLNGRS